jgi:hypothetical protein
MLASSQHWLAGSCHGVSRYVGPRHAERYGGALANFRQLTDVLAPQLS